MNLKRQLLKAMGSDALIRLERSNVEDGSISGYVVALGPEFFLMEVLDDSIRLDGFYCLRYRDVTNCKVPSPTHEFVEKALQIREFTRAEKPQIDLSSIGALLESAGAASPVITIHPEEADPGTCFIGRFVHLNGNILQLMEITPDGEWDDEPEEHAIDEITRVDFGGGYEEALLLVAGDGAG
jgi:hypothetical protein